MTSKNNDSSLSKLFCSIAKTTSCSASTSALRLCEKSSRMEIKDFSINLKLPALQPTKHITMRINEATCGNISMIFFRLSGGTSNYVS